ncbi:hypothetical protein P167DRAFT_543914 [Morchella conica CCBAS932]|uniref:Uncharacterized protein n=1 Tax=Morchella conica CCBAS932 TaxID=1392247 RepID=A0A3N4KUY8_9PEZI|nr:hypothetical protein P167DRAFT_543914 [Morchella conica CCBAS932]
MIAVKTPSARAGFMTSPAISIVALGKLSVCSAPWRSRVYSRTQSNTKIKSPWRLGCSAVDRENHDPVRLVCSACFPHPAASAAGTGWEYRKKFPEQAGRVKSSSHCYGRFIRRVACSAVADTCSIAYQVHA